MASRPTIFRCLRTQQPLFSTRSFSCSAKEQAQAESKASRNRRDPYAVAQAKARKVANISRQELLRKEQVAALGDPIRGVETDFTKSFDSPPPSEDPSKSRLNFFLTQEDHDKTIERSAWLNAPYTEPLPADASREEREFEAKRKADVESKQKHTAEVMSRLTNLSMGSSKDKLRVNIQRCIDEFGRHNTDKVLARRPTAAPTTEKEAIAVAENAAQAVPRVGRDTGSSEVQIAILTAKIRGLLRSLTDTGKQDKHNRRNLTLLVHKRAKLLKYLHRRERGGPRWQNCIQTLGLTEGTWKGEITLPRYLDK